MSSPAAVPGPAPFSVSAQSGRGLLGTAGTLHLDAAVLRFTPRSARPAWLGGGGMEVALREIEGISTDGGLAVEAGGQVWRFTGGGVAPLALLLESELLAMRGEPSRFAPGARYLVQGEARWEAEGGEKGHGHVMLVRDRLLWWTGRGPVQELPLARVRTSGLEQATGALIVDDGAQETLFHSAAAGALCAWLAVAEGAAEVGEGARVFAGTGGTLGGRVHLGVAPGRLVWVRGGRGGTRWVVPVARLWGLHGRGTSLELVASGGRQRIELDGVEGAEAVRRVVLDEVERWAQLGAAWGGTAAERFDPRLPAVAGEEARLLRPALRLEGEQQATGTLCLFEESLVFVPADGTAPEVLPVDGLVRSRAVGPHLVGIVGRRAVVRLGGPAAEVDALWDLLQAPARLLTGTAITAAALARLQGEAAWLRVGAQGADEEPVETGAVRLKVVERTVRIEVEGRPPAWLKPGVALELELGRREGLTHVHAAARRVQPVGRRWRLDLEPPDRIEIFNKREAYRAPAEGTAQLREPGGGPLGSAELRDLSASGIGLRAAPTLAAGRRVEVELLFEDEAPLVLEARVVRESRASDGVVLGLKIAEDELDEARHTELAALVMRLQLKWLARRLGEGDMAE